MRQLLTEAVVLSVLGASLGVVLAQIDVTLPLVPDFTLPRLGGIVIDARVMASCLGLSLISALLIGLVPAQRVIDASYFKTMGIPLVAGREFTARDTAEAPKVAIVSERIVREYFPGGPGEALGRRVRLSDHGEWLTVVGVAADIRQTPVSGTS